MHCPLNLVEMLEFQGEISGFRLPCWHCPGQAHVNANGLGTRGALNMIRKATILAASMALAACTTGRDELFLNMNEQELAAYNAELPERRQIVCAEGVRHGTARLIRKVCTSAARMDRLIQPSGADDYSYVSRLNDPGFNRRTPDDKSALPRVYFSPPPPGYDRPIIHVMGRH